LGFIKRLKPDTIYINGDWADMYSISRFDKNPERVLKYCLRNESTEVHNSLVEIRNAVGWGCEIIYIKGNHEARLVKYLWKRPELLNIVSIPELFCLKELDIRYEEDCVKSGKFMIYHGTVVRQDASYTAKAEFLKNGCSGISGHTHRDGKYTKRNRSGNFVWYENFCMCDLNAEYIEGIANWSQGWSVLHTVNRRQYVEQVVVINHRYVYSGKEYK
jgi:predicted phosphodiesterase